MIERIKCSDTAMMMKPREHGTMANPMVAAARMSGMSTSPAPFFARSAFDVDVASNEWVMVKSSLFRAPPYRGTV
jgi:hypothetical protein